MGKQNAGDDEDSNGQLHLAIQRKHRFCAPLNRQPCIDPSLSATIDHYGVGKPGFRELVRRLLCADTAMAKNINGRMHASLAGRDDRAAVETIKLA